MGNISKNLVAQFIYNCCKRFCKKRETVATDKPVDYFSYEVEKAAIFDRKFNPDFCDKVVLEIGCNVGGYMWHILEQSAKYVWGIEIDDEKCNHCRKLLSEHYEGNNYRVIQGDARNMFMIDSDSIDIVVSDAVVEHIRGIGEVFSEIERILKPGGVAFTATSPMWFSWNGGHLRRYIPIPWAHLLLPDDVVLKVLEMRAPSEADVSKLGNPAWPKSNQQARTELCT